MTKEVKTTTSPKKKNKLNLEVVLELLEYPEEEAMDPQLPITFVKIKSAQEPHNRSSKHTTQIN